MGIFFYKLTISMVKSIVFWGKGPYNKFQTLIIRNIYVMSFTKLVSFSTDVLSQLATSFDRFSVGPLQPEMIGHPGVFTRVL